MYKNHAMDLITVDNERARLLPNNQRRHTIARSVSEAGFLNGKHDGVIKQPNGATYGSNFVKLEEFIRMQTINDTEIPVTRQPQRQCCKSSFKAVVKFLRSKKTREILNYLKVFILLVLTVVCSVVFAFSPFERSHFQQLSVSVLQPHEMTIENEVFDNPILKLYIRGSFLASPPHCKVDSAGAISCTENVTVIITSVQNNQTEVWSKALAEPDKRHISPDITDYRMFDFSQSEIPVTKFKVKISSTTSWSTPLSVDWTTVSTEIKNQVGYAAAILVGVYILIIFELVHRTLAALLGSMATLAVLAALNEKPSLDKILDWIDFGTLSLLFGMMILVAIFCETGFFDWIALKAYKIAQGRVWPLITLLCIFAACISAFLDNVTTVLLLTPVTIRLCEVLNIDPKHVLIAEVLFSNIGGTATAIGDPPNVIIVSNEELRKNGIDFATFTMHMSVGVLFVILGAYLLLRIIYRRQEVLKNQDPPEVAELKHEIEIWRRASRRISVASREEWMVKELLTKKAVNLQNRVRQREFFHGETAKKAFETNLIDLGEKYRIRDWPLLIKSSIVLLFVILGFFLEPFIEVMQLNVGWIAIIGAIWLTVLSDFSELEGILEKIEWATLLFFAALFALMGGLTELGLIKWIVDHTTALVQTIDEESRLVVAIIIVLWISALVSSFIDNIPFTTAMVPVVIQLGADKNLNLPVQPLVWALAFGSCLGGNGTLIGASANVVCAGIAETHGHGFNFKEFFRIGFPMMLLTTFIAMVYLLICHCALQWNG